VTGSSPFGQYVSATSQIPLTESNERRSSQTAFVWELLPVLLLEDGHQVIAAHRFQDEAPSGREDAPELCERLKVAVV
jgi:hypothetical protein